jgi:hypothetical protein
MIKREHYSEELESQYRRLERKYTEVIKNLDKTTRSKGSQEILDSTHDFFTICYHLREWVQKDEKVNRKIKSKLPLFENRTMQSNNLENSLLICRDLCNSFKHRKLDERGNPNDASTTINSVGGALFMVPIKELQDREKGKTIHLKDEDSIFMGDFTVSFRNNQYDLGSVVKYCMHFWKTFFEENNLLMPRSG